MKIKAAILFFALLTSLAVQAQTNLLLHDLQAEGCCKKNFVPSPDLVKKYNLRKDCKTYYASGFLHVAGNFRPSNIQDFSIKINTQLDSLWTVQIPIQNLEKLLQTKGVKSFEVGRKAQMKKLIMKK
ncbi:MAG: hypothetical protein LBU92_04170 [Prevotellaceae bacterium]|jgi:hypothetical protein|nr:hypothetical protein [Prevotellaceae bacterium]